MKHFFDAFASEMFKAQDYKKVKVNTRRHFTYQMVKLCSDIIKSRMLPLRKMFFFCFF